MMGLAELAAQLRSLASTIDTLDKRPELIELANNLAGKVLFYMYLMSKFSLAYDKLKEEGVINEPAWGHNDLKELFQQASRAESEMYEAAREYNRVRGESK